MSERKMYTKKDVCAVVVVYNGEKELLVENITQLLKQVDKLVVVDNASSNSIIEQIAEFIQKDNVELITNAENAGIATALNQGLRYAKENGYKLFLSMDQDSVLADNSVDNMIFAMEKYSLVTVGANVDLDTVTDDSRIEIKNFLISSGNLTLTDIAVKVGGFLDKLFIDCVDIDFSLKIRKMGFDCAIAKNAGMKHNLGEPRTAKFLFIKKRICVHTPFRVYYMFRNMKYIIATYKKDFKGYIKKLKVANFLRELTIRYFFPKDIRKDAIKQMKRGKREASILTEHVE